VSVSGGFGGFGGWGFIRTPFRKNPRKTHNAEIYVKTRENPKPRKTHLCADAQQVMQKPFLTSILLTAAAILAIYLLTGWRCPLRALPILPPLLPFTF
jgi:hypothetical protein